MDRNECPLQRERQWSDPDNCRFELRWRNERLIEWKNSASSIAQDLSKEKISEVSQCKTETLQPFALKNKQQTFSRVCLRLKRRVCHFKRLVWRWKRECYRSADAAAILGVTVMF